MPTRREFKNLIAIEGGDGSGKGTQTELLREYIGSLPGKSALKVSFPRYKESSGRYAGRYLDGQYGSANQVHPDLGVLPFAIDRFAAKDEIAQALKNPNTFVVLDRYMASNLAHQGAKIEDTDARQAFYDETLQLEYDLLQIPRPFKNIVLLVSTDVAQQNVDKKDAKSRTYTKKQRDVHEADATHLDRAKANYQELCQLYPSDFIAINCMDELGKLRTIDSIQQEIRLAIGI